MDNLWIIYGYGWWLTYPSEKYEFVNWDDEIPNWMEKYNSCSKSSTGYSMVISGTEKIGATYHISGRFFRAKCQGISPQNLAINLVPGTSIESDLEIPIDILGCHNWATIGIGFGHKNPTHICVWHMKNIHLYMIRWSVRESVWNHSSTWIHHYRWINIIKQSPLVTISHSS